MNSRNRILILTVVLAAGVFAGNLVLPPTVAGGVLYVAVVMASLQSPKRNFTLITAFGCSLLVALAFIIARFTQYDAEVTFAAMINSAFALMTIWATATLGTRNNLLEFAVVALWNQRKQSSDDASDEVRASDEDEQSSGDASSDIASSQVASSSEDEQAERERAEQALRESESLYSLLVEHLPVHVFRKDLTGRLTFASPSYCRLMDRPLDELLGKTDFDLFPQELAVKYRANDKMVMETEQVFEDIEEHQTPQGGKIFVQVLKTPVYDSEGSLIGVQGIFWDVTDRKLAEILLRESELRKRSIFESSMDCIIFTDGEERVVEFNRAAEKTFGYNRRDVVGRDVAELIVPAEDRQRFRQNISRYTGAGEVGSMLSRRVEIPLLRSDGETFLAELAIQPIPLDGAAAFAIFVRDITDRKRSEAALRQARESAEFASAAKGRFLADMSHEIRTPMSAIIGIADLLLASELTSEQREFLNMLLESGESLLFLINDLLDLSKIEAGKLDLDRTEFDFRERFGDAVKSMAFRAHSKGLELACRVARDVPEAIIGDPVRLRQIVVNLVGNAVKFTECGEVVVHVQCQSQSDHDVVLRFTVTDTGVGIPENKLEAVFGAFEQADRSTPRRFGGAGLGLAISSRLVEQMGGKIWVESQVGQGSTFHFTACFNLPPCSAGPRPLPQTCIVGLRVLIVDDNATSRGILEEMLGNWEMQPTAVANAEEALRQIERASAQGRLYPVAVIDANMPRTDGFALAEQIQQRCEQATKVVMLLSSGDRPGDIARCEQMGIAAYLMKPVKQSELFDTLLALIEPVTIDRESENGPSEPSSDMAPLRILLAEDTLINQRLAVGLLEQQGHEVVVADNGVQALAALELGEFDLVLMDVQMPEMDGLEATARIRQREKTTGRHVPIVAMTARAMKGDRERCLDAGMDGYLAKPIRSKDLYAAIRTALSQADSAMMEAATETDKTADADASTGVVVDWAAATKAVQGDERLLKLVIEASLEEYPRLMDELRRAVDHQDALALLQAAHAIKGSIRIFGATRAYELAYQLETMARDDDLTQAAETLTFAEEEFARVLAELAEYLDKNDTC